MYDYICRTSLRVESELEGGLGRITHQPQLWHHILLLVSFRLTNVCVDRIHGQKVVRPAFSNRNKIIISFDPWKKKGVGVKKIGLFYPDKGC